MGDNEYAISTIIDKFPVIKMPKDMNESEKLKLIEAWVALQKSLDDSAEHEDKLWASEEFWELSENKPMICWELILQIINTEDNARVIGNLAAGPLEDLLSTHGNEFIAMVEKEAALNEKFRSLLGGVWQNEISDEVWNRIQSISGPKW